tara:strand:- start:406 stop:804 length:399 start_codon:yes stop_codon:yes gene_type:complete
MFVIYSFDDHFFKQSRTQLECESEKPDDGTVQKEGDYSESFWMKNFFDGKIDMSRQTTDNGYVILSINDSERMLRSHNPLRDPVILVKRDGQYALRDGFHRIHEARARNYMKRVWTIVLDMDEEMDDTCDTP